MTGDTIEIDAPPQRIWPHIADLALMRQWHPKLVSAEPVTSGQPRVGHTWRTVSRMRSREKRFVTRIEVCEPFTRLVFAHADDDNTRRVVRETFELTPRGPLTRVRQSIDLREAGIALPWRLLIEFISRFGTRSGEPVFAELKRSLEARAT
jgi:uncharacterized protein YndB with AHSA1/START domain